MDFYYMNDFLYPFIDLYKWNFTINNIKNKN